MTARLNEAAVGLVGEVAKQIRRETRRELVGVIRAVDDAPTHLSAQCEFARLAAHRGGHELARMLDEHLDDALVHLLNYYQGLVRTNPEWLRRDFRKRVSHGHNHGTDVRLDRRGYPLGRSSPSTTTLSQPKKGATPLDTIAIPSSPPSPWPEFSSTASPTSMP